MPNRYYGQGYRGYFPQGGGFYNPFMKGPDIAGGINALTGIIAQQQAMEQAEEQQTWKRGMEEAELGLAGRQVEMAEAREQRLAKPEPLLTLSPEMEKFATDVMGYPKEIIPKLGNDIRGLIVTAFERTIRPTPERAPTTFEQKLDLLTRGVQEGAFTPEQFESGIASLLGIKPPPEVTPTSKATIQQANENWMRQAYKDMGEETELKNLRDLVKKAGGQPPVLYGMRLDMPWQYNIATKNQKDGVATPEDVATIEKYDYLFSIFLNDIIPSDIKKFKDFIKLDIARDPLIDKEQFRRWFYIYKSLL